MDIFKNINYDNLTDEINQGMYTENTTLKENDTPNSTSNNENNTTTKYKSLIDAILSKYEYEYIISNNKDVYREKILIEIASKLDEQSDEYYDKFNYRKTFSKKLIQRGLLKYNSLSSVLYLIDYYKNNIVIYDKSKDTFIILSNKYPANDIYEFNGNGWSVIELDIDKSKSVYINKDHNYMNNDIKSLNIYNTSLKPISNYKLDELKNLASENNIDINVGSKKKTKKQIYDELYQMGI